ncbi:MAG: CopG family antitoxin [Dehalococcoidia bacterium]|nr:CopG family antitoxin [Dehalococcoidia bacterium]
MTEKERKTRLTLPEFQSHQEMAEFWDTHDFTDYMDDFKPVIPIHTFQPQRYPELFANVMPLVDGQPFLL